MPTLASAPTSSRPSPSASSGGLDSYLAELLADQQKLQTPVTRAAAAHSLQPSAWRAERFRELIPLSKPASGEQYAFEVDLDSCSGCKACVSGCHSLNGLDEEETWRDIGVVYGLSALAAPVRETNAPSSSGLKSPPSSLDEGHHPFAQTITTACHHCADPACLNGCPVLAYEKDPVTGIVRHLDDQCIGCSYCVLKCPYDVPKYNERLGIVRKCDMCHGRLADGEAPACVQSCPTQAIRIVTVASEVKPDARVAAISGTDSAYTRPSTRYVSKKPIPETLRAADADTLRPQHSHAPLVFLLTFTQLSLGLLLATLAESQISNLKSQISAASAALFAAGLAVSVFHLGQPLRAWRVFLNLRRSWLSREAVLLGAAFPLVVLVALLPRLPALAAALPLPAPVSDFIGHWSLVIGHSALLPTAAIALTAAGVFSSAALYIDTHRRFWRPAYTFGRMGGTVAVAALAFVSGPLAAAALVAKLALESLSLFGKSHPARLQRGPLLGHLAARFAAAGFSILLFAVGEPLFAFVFFTLGEVLERALYFRAVDSPKMPGLSASAPSCPVH